MSNATLLAGCFPEEYPTQPASVPRHKIVQSTKYPRNVLVPCTFYKSEPQPLRGVPFHDRPWLPELAVSRQEAARGHESHDCATRSLGSAPVLPGRRPMTLIRAHGRLPSHPRSASSLHSGYTGPTMAAYGGGGVEGASSDGGKPTPQRPSRSFRYRYRHPQWGKVSTGKQALGDLHQSPRPSHAMPCHAMLCAMRTCPSKRAGIRPGSGRSP
jgi:hypothetical protein